jgi:hypothetical protein
MSYEEFLDRIARHCRHPEKTDPELERMKNADFLTWARHFLPHYFPLPPSEMHLWLASQLDRISTRAH